MNEWCTSNGMEKREREGIRRRGGKEEGALMSEWERGRKLWMQKFEFFYKFNEFSILNDIFKLRIFI